MTQNSDSELFAKYIGGNKILIADTSSASRIRMAAMLNEMGAGTHMITLADSFDAAVQEMARVKPKVVLCDYILGNQSGLDLLQAQRKEHPESKDCLFALVTANSSQSAVARAAEEDVDTFILKPYTQSIFKSAIITATVAKMFPSDYMRIIDAGKELLFSGKPAEGLKEFNRAMELHPMPTLACFYRGQAEAMMKAMDEAQTAYEQGLNYNKIHYKCLVGLYDLLMEKRKHEEAYSVVKRIAQYFPANPARLANVLRLAIMTKNYKDMESYYEIFVGIDNRTEDLVKYICSAMIVCGKYYLNRNDQEKALKLFDRVGISSGSQTRYLGYTIEAMVEYNLFDQAQKMLDRYPAGVRKQPEYLSYEYLVNNGLKPSGILVEQGRQLLKEGVQTPMIYKILIQRSFEAGLKAAADDLILEASRRWPELSGEFKAYQQAAG